MSGDQILACSRLALCVPKRWLQGVSPTNKTRGAVVLFRYLAGHKCGVLHSAGVVCQQNIPLCLRFHQGTSSSERRLIFHKLQNNAFSAARPKLVSVLRKKHCTASEVASIPRTAGTGISSAEGSRQCRNGTRHDITLPGLAVDVSMKLSHFDKASPAPFKISHAPIGADARPGRREGNDRTSGPNENQSRGW